VEYLDQPFEVSTGSSRRPTPVTYKHLRKWIEEEKHVLPITTIEQLTNVNQFLEQQATLYISNIIQQVIAQLIGQTETGFATIKGTDDGELHVYAPGIGAIADDIVAAGAAGSLSAKLRRVTQALEDLKTTIVLASGSTVSIAGTSQTELSAEIDISGTSPNDIIGVDGTKSHHICSIMFTVDGATDVTLHDDGSVTSGPMDFGGTDEPRGMTHNFGLVPLVCGAGKKFQITLGADVNVHGIVTYYSE